MLALLVFSCKEKAKNHFVNEVEYESHELVREVEAGDWIYAIHYKPTSYILSYEGYGSDTLALARRKKQLDGTAWFNIDIKHKNGTAGPLRFQTQTEADYQYKHNYYLNEAAKHLCLIYGQDSLAPLSYVFETSYNVAPQETIVVGFLLPDSSERPEKQMQLIFKDALLQTGIVKAFFSKETLLNLPQ